MAAPYRISIGVEVDAAKVQPGTGQATRAITGIGEAADRARPQLDKLINTMIGLDRQGANNNGRAADIAAYGAELDRLRAKYNPLYAVTMQYRQAQAEIRDAHRLGAISADEMTAALSRNRQATLASIDAIKGRNAAVVASRQVNQGFAATNVMYQAQDIGVTAAMGMSPAMIGLQQGSQIAGAYAGMTLKEAASTTGAALAGLVSPVSLAAVGLTAASAAAIQFGMSLASSATETKTLDDALKAHQDNLTILKSLYGDLGEAIKQAGSETSALSNAQLRQNDALMRSVARQQNNAMMSTLTGTDGWFSPLSGKGTSVSALSNLTGSQAPFQSSVDSLLQSVRAGKPDLDAFRASVEATFQRLLLTSDDPVGLRNAADAVQLLGDNALSVAGKYKPFQDAINRLKVEMADGTANVSAFHKEVERVGQATGLQKLADEVIVLGKDLVGLNNAMQEQARIQETLDRRRSHNYGTAGTAFEADQRFRQLNLERSYRQSITDLGAISPQERAAAARLREQERFDPKESAETRNLRIETAGRLELARAEKTLADARRDRVQSISESLEAQQLELSLIGRTTAETEAMRMEYRLTAQAKAEAAKNGIEVDQEELALIREKSRAYGELAEQIAGANLLRGQEQQIAGLRAHVTLVGASDETRRRSLAMLQAEQDLRERGIASESAMARLYRQNASLISEMTNALRKQEEAWGKIRQTGENTIDSLVDGLLDGDIEGAFENVAKDITKTLTQLAISNPLKNSLLGTDYGTISDVGGIGGIFSRLFGGGDQAVSSMAVTAGTVVLNGGLSAGGGGMLSGLLGANDNKSLSDFAQAIKSIESSGNYSALGPITASGDRAYGAYQVMGANIPSWTKQALGQSLTPQQFLGNASAQDAVFEKIFGGYVSKYGANGAAQAWFGGPGSVGKGGNAADLLGTTGTSYVQKFNTALGNATQSTNVAAQGLGNLGSGFNSFGQTLTSFYPASPTGGGSGGLFGSLFSGLFGGGWNQSIIAGSPQVAGAISSGTWGLWDKGGPTGGNDAQKVAGLVHEKEYVFDAVSTAKIGVPTLEAIRRGAIRGYSTGGYVTTSPFSFGGASAGANNNTAPSIQILNQTSTPITGQVEETTDDSGRRQYRLTLSDEMAAAAEQKGGAFRRSMQRQYALRPKGIVR